MSDRWFSRDEHPGEFIEGDRYMIAVPERTRRRDGTITDLRWGIYIVTVDCDEDFFCLRDCTGEVFDAWQWGDVEYYRPMTSVEAELPPLGEEVGDE